MHYYSYTSPTDRSINPKPILSLFLERRSLVVTTGSLYTEHLHGIEGVEEDVFGDDEGGVANERMVRGQREREMLQRGGTLRRSVRYSLTCRDVARVASVGTAKMFGRK